MLLSVCQTCHFNGVNVLRFLLSGRADLASILAGTCDKPGEPIESGRWGSAPAGSKSSAEETLPAPAATAPHAAMNDTDHPAESQ
jgi:hypothetical protein